MRLQFLMRRLLAVLALAFAAAPAHAQLTVGVKRAMLAAASVCVDWMTGEADYAKTAPEGYRAPTVFEELGFRIGAWGGGVTFTGKWVQKAKGEGGPLWIIGIKGGCMATVESTTPPGVITELAEAFEGLLKARDPSAGELRYFNKEESPGSTMAFYELDADTPLVVGFQYGWEQGKPARGSFVVIVQPSQSG